MAMKPVKKQKKSKLKGTAGQTNYSHFHSSSTNIASVAGPTNLTIERTEPIAYTPATPYTHKAKFSITDTRKK